MKHTDTLTNHNPYTPYLFIAGLNNANANALLHPPVQYVTGPFDYKVLTTFIANLTFLMIQGLTSAVRSSLTMYFILFKIYYNLLFVILRHASCILSHLKGGGIIFHE